MTYWFTYFDAPAINDAQEHVPCRDEQSDVIDIKKRESPGYSLVGNIATFLGIVYILQKKGFSVNVQTPGYII